MSESSRTWQDRLPPKYVEYYAEFGRFMSEYAKVEAGVHLVFRHCLGCDDAVGRAISGGQRLGDVIGMTKRVAAARGLAVVSELDAIFKHLDDVSKLRDALVHRGASFHEDELVATTALTAKTPAGVQTLRLRLGDIQAATEDCQLMFLRLTAIRVPDLPLFQRPEAHEWLSSPWRYTPPPQPVPRQTRT